MVVYSRAQKYAAEFIGTAFLLATIVGAGIMAERLSGGNVGVALLGDTIPIGAILVVLITMLMPISGAHFNPAVTLVFALKREIALADSAAYVFFQVTGGIAGVLIVHLMFEETLIQFSGHVRTGGGQWLAEVVATFGLLFTVLATLKARPSAVPMAVGLYITAAIWFTSSTSFANPAVTIARLFSDSFTGIRPEDIYLFILAEFAGAILAWLVCGWLLSAREQTEAVPEEISD